MNIEDRIFNFYLVHYVGKTFLSRFLFYNSYFLLIFDMLLDSWISMVIITDGYFINYRYLTSKKKKKKLW